MRMVLILLVGVVAYLGLHLGVLRKPLTIGYIRAAYESKLDAARAVAGPKIVVVGGSSSLFSLRCQTIAAELGKPCVNLAVTAGIGIDLILAKAEPAIGPGDVVVMPLEYDFYQADRDAIENNSLANLYAATYDRDLLAGFGWHRRLAAAFAVNLQDMAASGVEMALDARGFQRRFTLAQLTAQGDMSGHTPDKAAAYAGYLAGLTGAPALEPRPQALGMVLLSDFIARQRAKGARVLGTFPATMEGDGQAAPAIRAWWRGNGDGFVDVPGDGRFPRDQFFDTLYHLAEPAQIAHSRHLAASLRQVF